MRRIVRTALAATALVVAAGSVGAGVAAAESTPMPFSQKLRRCDFSEFFSATALTASFGRPSGQLRTDGGDIVADVQIATAAPNTRYDVRVIQVPRSPAATCNAGDPGVAAASFVTDVVGAGAATVRGPLVSGATRAWIFVSRPSAFSQQPDEFYTTDFAAEL